MRKIFTLLILLLLLPVTALAVEGAPGTLWVGQTQITGSGYWKTNSDGTLTTEGANNDNYNVYYDGNGTLTLKDAKISGSFHQYNNPFTAGIYALCSSNQPVALTIELIGTNTITGHYGIYVNAEQGQTVGTNASLLIQNSGDNGILEVSGSSDGIYVKSGTGNASLTINDASVVAKTTQTYSGGHAGVYVQSSIRATSFPQLSLAVNGGSLTTSASEGNDGIQFYVGLFQATGDTTNLTVSDNAIVRANGGIKAYHVDEPTPSGTGIVFDGTEGTVYGNVTLQEDITIGEGESLTIGNGASLNTGSYEVIVNGGTLDGVDKITGTVKYAPAITTQPTSQTVTEGETATFTVEASGTELLSYQWQQSTDNGNSWTNIDSANAAEYATGQTTTSMNGYQYRCMVSNSVGSVESNAATLTVNAKPTYTITAVSSPAEGGTATADKTTAAAGETITLIATPSSGYYFVEWKVVSGAVSIQNNKFTMPAENVEVQAVFGLSVTSITLDKTELSLYTGDSETLTATIEPDNATNKNVTWSSDNADVAIVNNGTVKAMGAGDATITVTTEDVGKTATCVVQVRKPATVEASGSTNLSFTTDRNEFTLTAIVYGENLSQEPNCWEWTVANTDVVSLSDTPNLRSGSVASSRKAFTIKGTGTTTITTTYDDGIYRGSVYFTVRISKPTPPDPISYYNIYVEDVCDGVEVSTSKKVVREGGSINVSVEKDTARYTFDNFKVYYKRSYYGGWEELKEGTQPGEYPIKNIWNHIYIKAEGAEEKEDPTGIESIEGVKVYTKDGSLYVQTPQREQVIIVSMSGAVVKNEEQIGLKQYHGLQPGIYIVRVGDRAYKLRLH